MESGGDASLTPLSAADAAAQRPRGEAESEARLRAIVDNAVDSIISIDEQGLITDFNPAAQRLFGYGPNEVIGRNINMLMPEPYSREHDGYLRHYRRTGERRIIGIGREVSGRRKDGTVFPLELTVSEVKFGERRLFTGIVRDATERRRVEDERQKFVSLVENSSDLIAMASLSWELLYVNKAGQTLLGISPEEVSTLEVRDLWHDSKLPILTENAQPLLATGESFRFEAKARHLPTGAPIDVDCNVYGIVHPDTGAIVALAFSLRDIRDQKRTEQALRDGEARIKAILDSTLDGIVTIDERGIIVTVNPAAEAIFDYTTEELVGQNIKILMPEPYHGEHDQYLRNYRHTGHRKIIGIGREVAGRRRDGTIFPLDLSVSEVNLGDRRLFTGLIRDITERKQAEEHRDLLVAELSHRVKNTLATVTSVAHQTFRQEASMEGARGAFEGRVQTLAQAHTRLAESNWAGADLRTVLMDEVSAYRSASGQNISAAGPAVMLGPKSAVSLGMAFHELATNAVKHGALSVPDGRVEVIWTVTSAGAEKQLQVRWREQGGPKVSPPVRSGFGRMLLERGLPYELGGVAMLTFPEEGVQCTIAFPLPGQAVRGDAVDG